MLSEDNPSFQNWDQEETAIAERYDLQCPSTVSDAFVRAVSSLADQFQKVSGTEWLRPGIRSDGSAYTIATLGALALHDPIHHLWDVSRSA